ncbi:hypothetical protein [Streptomyces lincolnensis]|uniref:hypothetical protein n=1 Tax=Streptomyces lincolnensis TaxID=1915 RepID=UPI0037D044D6
MCLSRPVFFGGREAQDAHVVPAVAGQPGEVVDVAELQARGRQSELEDAVGLPGRDEFPAEGAVRAGAVDGGRQVEGL